AVVVHLGTNDFAAGDPGGPFLQAYVDFVRDVHTRYANARIYCAVSPMLSGTKRTMLTDYLNQVIAMRAAAGDHSLALITFAPPDANTGWGCGHPNAATHVIMANLLTRTLKTDLGW
ncbi:MAG TPA: GDSL-type esterase/lipase family protein, partial [Polyangia bacterium]|nr:GDSL-type esterase/lipase family protein [Polyangia bacterium]